MSGSSPALSPLVAVVSGSRPRLLIYSQYALLVDALISTLGERFDIKGVRSITALLDESANDFNAVVVDVGATDQASLRAMEWELSRRKLPVILLMTDDELTRYSPSLLSSTAVCRAEQGLDRVAATLDAVVKPSKSVQSVPRGDSLTERQVEVLRLIAQGLRCKEIANSLGISIRTAEFHRAAIMDRLRLRSSAELTRFAILTGIAL